GKMITTIDATRGTREILAQDGVALAYVEPRDAQVARRRGAEKSVRAALVAVDGISGEIRWRQPCGPIHPLSLAIDDGRVLYLAGKKLHGLGWKDGRQLWQVQSVVKRPKAFVAIDGVVVMHDNRNVAAHDASDGRLLWKKRVAPLAGAESEDLFVIDGLAWRGMECVDDELKHVKHSPNVLLVGWDLRTGEEKRRIVVKNFRSPEHHHRCYRNKATDRYVISSFEGAEFVDLKGDNHRAGNWLRGSCKSGMMPCNGMLYVPPDQCFCQPGAKLLGYAAVTAADGSDLKHLDEDKRLEKGPAYKAVAEARQSTDADWPTFRHDAARHGTTANRVPANVSLAWKADLQGPLTAPVAAGDKVFVAESDAHRVNALDMATGKLLWQFTAAGRIDSPPTIYRGMVLFGSNDGRVYCLRAADGQLAWKFLAAPLDRRIASFEQLESVWPVHGSVLLGDGVAYCTAGRSTYLDGGIHLYGLDPATGEVLHRTTLEGPHRTVEGARDVAFFIPGANSDVLVSEGGFIYMRQKKLTPRLKEVDVEVLSSKGAQDVGLHVFSTAGLLDGSWYNRTFWMYSKRWPGFQLANQAPKTGQILVVDDENTYAVRVFHRRNRHSTMFFPGKEGYLLFADKNTTEPQIVGEPGSREPVRWLPQSEYLRGRPLQPRALDSEAFGLDKMVGYTRAEPPLWKQWLPVRIRAMVKAGETLFVAGPPDELDPNDPYAAFENRKGARLLALSSSDGITLVETKLNSPPVFDAMIAAHGRLFISLEDGTLVCLSAH
ncbi:MAG: PQQ-binding-like beta-propeller repeat protein, partial [Planctomycetota bacterium]|nr:PQQ-binding-like beta-propeller repeat protein [Planctomycetota bacterium]